MLRSKEEIFEERNRLKAKYGELFSSFSALLFWHDPMGINFEDNADEYEPEVGTILPRFHECHSEDEACRVIHEEFVVWFGEDIAGSEQRYREIVSEIWPLWLKSKSSDNR